MTNWPSSVKRIALATVICLTAWTLHAAEIRDDAGIFGADTVAAAKEKLNAAQAKAHHGVTIETYATLPSGKAKAVEAMSSSERSQFYSDWLKQRAKQAHAEGLFVLITKEPGHVEVGVSGKLQAAGYTTANKKAVVDAFLTAFREKEFDRGLSNAVEHIETDYASLRPVATSSRPISPSAPAQAPRYSPAPTTGTGGWTIGGMLMIGAVIVVVLMVISAIGRAFSGGPGGPMGSGGGGYGPNYDGGGGGGFGRGMLGGLLGGMAGSWLYDSFNHRSNSAFGGEQHSPQSPSSWGDSSSSSDDTWSTSGGDFGGSGGDFGGGDSGGGDSSGGDF